jgi:hypothetical protein
VSSGATLRVIMTGALTSRRPFSSAMIAFPPQSM